MQIWNGMGQGIFEPAFFGKVSGLVYIFRHKCSIPNRTTVTANFLVWIIWTLVFSILPSFIGFMVTKNMILNSPNVTQLCSSGYILSLLVLLPGQARSWSNHSVCQLDLAAGDWHIISFNGTHYLVEMDLASASLSSVSLIILPQHVSLLSLWVRRGVVSGWLWVHERNPFLSISSTCQTSKCQ